MTLTANVPNYPLHLVNIYLRYWSINYSSVPVLSPQSTTDLKDITEYALATMKNILQSDSLLSFH